MIMATAHISPNSCLGGVWAKCRPAAFVAAALISHTHATLVKPIIRVFTVFPVWVLCLFLLVFDFTGALNE